MAQGASTDQQHRCWFGSGQADTNLIDPKVVAGRCRGKVVQDQPAVALAPEFQLKLNCCQPLSAQVPTA